MEVKHVRENERYAEKLSEYEETVQLISDLKESVSSLQEEVPELKRKVLEEKAEWSDVEDKKQELERAEFKLNYHREKLDQLHEETMEAKREARQELMAEARVRRAELAKKQYEALQAFKEASEADYNLVRDVTKACNYRRADGEDRLTINTEQDKMSLPVAPYNFVGQINPMVYKSLKKAYS